MEKFDLKQITENKPLFYTIIICGVAIIIMFIMMVIALSTSMGNPTSQEGKIKAAEQVIKNDPVTLFTTDNTGKALEVQALLAREQITATKVENGSKVSIVLKEYTKDQRDRALLAIVKSGLVDEHTGLEIFDKGDFTSTKDDKKIRLIRAINGELARLIRKIPPIENAQVFISIPEQTFFSQDQKPITATVQITMPSGERLDNMKVKAISNLLLGAVHGLQSDNISITDTNGTVYNSIIGASDDAIAKLEENDKYMQSKVNAQLDRLLGKGNSSHCPRRDPGARLSGAVCTAVWGNYPENARRRGGVHRSKLYGEHQVRSERVQHFRHRPGGISRITHCGSAELPHLGAECAAFHDFPDPVRRQRQREPPHPHRLPV